MSLEGCAPFLLLLSSAPVQLDWFSLVRRKGLPGGTKQGCAAPSSDWGATVSLEASRLLPSRLVGFLLLPPTFNHLFTAVTQRKASPLEETHQTNLNLRLFGDFLGCCKSAGGAWAVWQEEMHCLKCFRQNGIFWRQRQQEKRVSRRLACPIVNHRNPPHQSLHSAQSLIPSFLLKFQALPAIQAGASS